MPDLNPLDQPIFEVQIHFADIRRGVKSFWMTRRSLRLWGAGLALIGLFLLFSALVAPQVIRSLLSRNEYFSLISARARQGQRLQQLVTSLEAVQAATEDLHHQLSRVSLVYGLPRAAPGRGGLTHVEGEVPESIYAADIRRGWAAEAATRDRQGALDVHLGELEVFETEHEDRVRTTPSTSPLEEGSFVLTSGFGTRRSPFTKEMDFHAGLDLAAAEGTPILAPADGVVVFAGRYNLASSVEWWRYGNLVAIRHGGRFISLFGHCDEMRVAAGRPVRQGDVIATVGNTGWSTNPHLHYEVRRLEGRRYRPYDPRIHILDLDWNDPESLEMAWQNRADAESFEPLPRLIR